MRILAAFILLSSVSAAWAAGDSSYVGSFTCKGILFRVKGAKPTDYAVDSRLEMDVKQMKSGAYSLSAYGGHLAIFDKPSDLKAGRPASLYAVYEGKNLAENTKFAGTKYKHHVAFANFDARNDFGGEGGVWGYLAINVDLFDGMPKKKSYDAHYVFQAGDHTGGTIDYSCEAR